MGAPSSDCCAPTPAARQPCTPPPQQPPALSGDGPHSPGSPAPGGSASSSSSSGGGPRARPRPALMFPPPQRPSLPRGPGASASPRGAEGESGCPRPSASSCAECLSPTLIALPWPSPFRPSNEEPLPAKPSLSPPPPSLAQPLPSTGHRLCPSRASGSADKGCRALQRPAFSEGGARRGEGYL